MRGNGGWTDLFPDVRVAATQQFLNFVGQISRHFLGRDIGKSAERQTDSVHVGVVHIAVDV